MESHMEIDNQNSSDKNIPEEIKGFNWGALLLNWIWGIGNNTYIAFLSLVPIINIFVIIFLGFKGNELAWKNGKWKDVDHFKRVQKNWAIWGFILIAVVILGLINFYRRIY